MRVTVLGRGVASLIIAGTIGLFLNPGTARAQAQSVDIKALLTVLKTDHCKADDTFALAMHGGVVFSRSEQGRKVDLIRQTLTEAAPLLASGARSIDVVEAVIAGMENSGVFNAGKGAIANKAGEVEMDASIMEGRMLKAGAVAGVKTVRNAISAARLVMDKSRNVMMIGPDADRFARDNGAASADIAYFLHGGQSFSDVPLPIDIQIVPPDDRIAPERVSFLGVWAGVWVGSLNHVLVVEKIETDEARVIYALGPGNDRGYAYFVRDTAQFVNRELKVVRPASEGGWTVTYRLNADHTLAAKATKAYTDTEFRTTLRRLENLGESNRGGTVGAVARDRCGDLAAGTSTGGFGSKTPGRVGDSAIIGAGTYADNETAAVSATGHGEFFMRHVVAHAIAAIMKHKGLSVDEVATTLIKDELFRKGLRGGVIAVDKDGNITMPYNTEGMVRGFITENLTPVVEIY